MNTKRSIKLKELTSSIRVGKSYVSKEHLGKGAVRVIKPINISNGVLTESVNDYFISSYIVIDNFVEVMPTDYKRVVEEMNLSNKEAS